MKFSNDDTIAAIITPPGEGGIGAIRIAGKETSGIVAEIFRSASQNKSGLTPFHLYWGHIIDRDGNIVDEVTLVQMPEGQSYTGQLQAEIFCHGGQFILRKILNLIFDHGARPAEPGEFTRRAFLAGRIDLARAEAVADIISSKTEYSYNAAKSNLMGEFSARIDNIRAKLVDLLAQYEAEIDYPEEYDVKSQDEIDSVETLAAIMNEISAIASSYKSGKIIREGFKIAIAGRPNAGKSSLFNLMLNQNRAIVAPVPGTTRDYLTEWIDLEGIAVSITDTAGIEKASNHIKRSSQEMAHNIMKASDMIIWVVDITAKNWKKNLSSDLKRLGDKHKILLFNKIDKRESALKSIQINLVDDAILFSCLTKSGYKELRKKIISFVTDETRDLTDGLIVTSERHQQKLKNAAKRLKNGLMILKKGESPELIAFELRQGINEIDEITGRIYNEEILDKIFSRFCIGK